MAVKKESLGRRSARTFSTLLVGKLISVLIGVASIVAITRLLGPENYGTFTLVYAFFLLLSAAANFGFGVYLAKHLSEAEDSNDKKGFGRALGAGYASIIIVGLSLTVLGMLISGYVASIYQMQKVTVLMLILASSTVFFSMVYGSSDYALIGVGKNVAAMGLEIFENIVLFAASIALILLHYGVDGAIVGIMISYVLASAIGTYMIFRFTRRKMHIVVNLPKIADIKGAFVFSLPVAINNLLNNGVTNFGTLFLGIFVSTYVLGSYGIANRAGAVISLFYASTALTLLPTLAIASARQDTKKGFLKVESTYNNALLYSVIAITPIVTYMGVFALPLIYLFISTSFASAPLYLSLMAFGTAVGLPGLYAAGLFIARAKTGKLIVYGVINTLVQLILLFVLVPKFKAIGAIISLFLVDSIVFDFLLLRGARLELGFRTNYGKLLRAFASNVALGIVFAAGFLANSFVIELIWGAIVSVLAYPFFLVIFGAFGKEDMTIVEEATEKLPLLRGLAGPFMSYFKVLTSNLQ